MADIDYSKYMLQPGGGLNEATNLAMKMAMLNNEMKVGDARAAEHQARAGVYDEQREGLRQEQMQMQQKQARAARMQKAAKEIWADPATAGEKYIQFLAEYPETAKAMGEVKQQVSKEQQAVFAKQIWPAAAALYNDKPKVALEHIKEHEQTEREANNAPAADAWATLADTFKADPTGGMARFGIHLRLANHDPEEFLKIHKQLEDSKAKETELGFEKELQPLKVAELRARLQKARSDAKSGAYGEGFKPVGSPNINPLTGVIVQAGMENGKYVRKVIAKDGSPVEGDAAAEAIAEGIEKGIDTAYDTSRSRREGFLDITTKKGGDAAEAVEKGKLSGKHAQELAMDAAVMSASYRKSISLNRQARELAFNGASSGQIMDKLPTLFDATTRLKQLQREAGLAKVQMGKFGQLSEGELRIALVTGLPMDLTPKELIKFLDDKIAVEIKIAKSFDEYATYMSSPEPGRNLHSWLKTRGATPAEDAVPERTEQWERKTGRTMESNPRRKLQITPAGTGGKSIEDALGRF